MEDKLSYGVKKKIGVFDALEAIESQYLSQNYFTIHLLENVNFYEHF